MFIPYSKPDIFVLKYIGTFIFLLKITWWKIFKRTKWVRPEDVDLVTGRRECGERESSTDSDWNTGFWKSFIARHKK